MKYKCSNGHENFSDTLPERCPVCGSTLLKVVSGGSATPSSGGTPPSAPPLTSAPPPTPPAWAAEAQPPALEPEPVRRRRWLLWLLPAAGLAVLALVLAAVLVLVRKPDLDEQMAAVARDHEQAVGVVVVSGQKNGQPFSEAVATAWAVGDRVFVSNGHVTQPVGEALARGWSAFIVLNKNPQRKLRVVRATTHPRYDEKTFNLEGKNPAVAVYDVGLLTVDEPVSQRFEIAPASELRKLDSGYRVAYLGFPMENLAGGGVDVFNPVANMQSGIITSTTDYWLGKASFEKSLLLAHNLAATGGSSGSPVFNAAGQVVGVLSAGNIVGRLDSRNGILERAPSAALINFAQRIDVLRDIYPDDAR
jgi:hypothetical protein